MEQNQALNAANAVVDGTALLEVGTLLGRRQAFGSIASKCSAADRRTCGKVRAGADSADSPLNLFDFGPDISIISDWLASYD
jgi:hypothetical protein